MTRSDVHAEEGLGVAGSPRLHRAAVVLIAFGLLMIGCSALAGSHRIGDVGGGVLGSGLALAAFHWRRS
jgi:hypothetical protein